MSRGPWRTLGLERTGDVAEIRRAYARKLKAIDPETDPQAFITLRGALEAAMAQARYAVVEPAGPEAGVDVSPAGSEPAMAWTPGQSEDAPLTIRIGEAAPEEDGDAAFRRLSGLLFDPSGAAPDPDALAAALDEVLADPRMEGVGHAERVEQWLAAELNDSIPRSDPVLASVVTHFGWGADNDRWDQPFQFARLAERQKALLFIDRISSPKHSHHGAYVELTREGADLGSNRFLIDGDVRDLLAAIRKRCPMAEDWLNPERVAAWDERERTRIKISPRGVMWFIWVGFILLCAISRCSHGGPTY